MPYLRTDDGPRRLRAMWLGPRGSRLPVDWTYVQWGVFLALLVLLLTVFGVTGYVLTGDPWLSAGVALWGLPPTFFLTRFIVEHADYDRPIKWWRRVIPGEWKRSRRVPAGETVRVLAPPARPLSAEVASVLYVRRLMRPAAFDHRLWPEAASTREESV